ncbi:MAG: hypothetical protein CMP11_08120 [Zetaproteobacteria bacterium]|nr:hypothetical protein [Pseudobdellovibrionaceae bacterium]
MKNKTLYGFLGIGVLSLTLYLFFTKQKDVQESVEILKTEKKQLPLQINKKEPKEIKEENQLTFSDESSSTRRRNNNKTTPRQRKKETSHHHDENHSVEEETPEELSLNPFIDQLYSDLFLELDLTKEDQKKLSTALTTANTKQQELVFSIFQNKKSSTEILEQQEKDIEEYKIDLDSFLTKDKSDKVDEYNRKIPEKIAKQAISNNLAYLNLDTNKSQEITDLIYEVQTKIQSKTLKIDTKNSSYPHSLTEESIETLKSFSNPEKASELKEGFARANKETAKSVKEKLQEAGYSTDTIDKITENFNNIDRQLKERD